MSYALFGVRNTLATYSSVETAFSVAPALSEPTRPALTAHLTEVFVAVSSLNDVLVQVVADAESRPLPPAPATLQELVAAGRTRLMRERARSDRDRAGLALGHLTRLRELVRP